MRTYAPANPEAVLEAILDEPSLARGVVHHAVLPARPPEYGDFPAWLDPRIVAGLDARGIERPYTHQAEAIESARAGQDVVVVTPTASGKSLCYTVPILQAIADDPAARALLLFPTKALGQDQVTEFAELSRAAGLHVSAATYDGDTPAPIRSAIRGAGQVVATNPDMLSSAILPHHTKWFLLFEQLEYIVIDELHTYRGVFGGHVANVIRRLLRICAHYGSHPVIVCCSATIGNPGELATALIGRPVKVVDRTGAPTGERHVLLVDPPLVDPASGARGSAVTLAQRWALPFLRANRQTIVFGRTRVAVELLLTGLRESLRESYGPRTRVRGYRGGYLPTERRAIEHGLRDGEILGVVATNALELGVDIGRLDASILAGYPGSIAATWQQFGRAGRRGGTSRRRPVASSAPVDQYVVHHPEFLLEGTPEEARADPDNLHVLLAHLRAAIFELPFEPGEVFGPAPADDLLAFLAEERHVRQAGDGRWYWSSENFPASEISLRTAAPGERRDHRHDAGPSARARRGRPVQRPGPRPRARHLHPRVDPVPRRPPGVDRAQGVRPPDRRRPLHVRQPRGDAQAARGLRRGAGHRRAAGPRRGHGRQPRHPLQEAQVPDRRERRLGPGRPSRARAPDDRLLADRRRGRRPAGDGTSSTWPCRPPDVRSRRSPACC